MRMQNEKKKKSATRTRSGFGKNVPLQDDRRRRAGVTPMWDAAKFACARPHLGVEFSTFRYGHL